MTDHADTIRHPEASEYLRHLAQSPAYFGSPMAQKLLMTAVELDSRTAELRQAQEERDRIIVSRDYERDEGHKARVARDEALMRCEQAIDALREIEPQQQRILEWFRGEGIIFDTAPGGDPKSWQHIAFTIYTALCEVDSAARAALVKLGEAE